MDSRSLLTALRSLRRDMLAAQRAPAVADMTPKQLTAALRRLMRSNRRVFARLAKG